MWRMSIAPCYLKIYRDGQLLNKQMAWPINRRMDDAKAQQTDKAYT